MKYDMAASHDQVRDESDRYFKIINCYIKVIIMSLTTWKIKSHNKNFWHVTQKVKNQKEQYCFNKTFQISFLSTLCEQSFLVIKYEI